MRRMILMGAAIAAALSMAACMPEAPKAAVTLPPPTPATTSDVVVTPGGDTVQVSKVKAIAESTCGFQARTEGIARLAGSFSTKVGFWVDLAEDLAGRVCSAYQKGVSADAGLPTAIYSSARRAKAKEITIVVDGVPVKGRRVSKPPLPPKR